MVSQRKRRGRWRIISLWVLLVIGLLVIAGRLVFIQAVEAKRYNRLALKQRLRAIELPPRRGAIYDREGEEVAISIETASIYATPYLVRNPHQAAKKLAPLLGIKEPLLVEKLTRDVGFVYLARKIDRQKAQRIVDLEIEGIGFLEESKRCYPCGDLASQVLGFVGMDNKGLSGLELYYDKVLRGKPGRLVAEKDPLGRSIPGGVLQISTPVDGHNIQLTIDKDIQYKAQVELKSCVEKYKAKGGSVIVLDPRSGEIYAMANEPSFNPNKISNADASSLRNRAITDLYEPGSTMKVVVAAAVLEERLFDPKSAFYLPSTIKVGDRTVGEAHKRGSVNYTLTEIVTHSSNVGAVKLGFKLGKERLYSYLKSFALTEPTGVDFPGEATPQVPIPDNWSCSTLGNVPFGQGLAVTGLHMTQLVSIIANDGLVVRPHFLSKAFDSKGKLVKRYSQDEGRKVISRQTTAEIGYIMEQVIKGGTGKEASVPGYRVGGKTGTAQKAKTNGGGYDPGRYVASFMGFAPAQDPQLVVMVIIDEPKEAIYGGVVAAPVFKKVMEFSLAHLRISPRSH